MSGAVAIVGKILACQVCGTCLGFIGILLMVTGMEMYEGVEKKVEGKCSAAETAQRHVYS